MRVHSCCHLQGGLHDLQDPSTCAAGATSFTAMLRDVIISDGLQLHSQLGCRHVFSSAQQCYCLCASLHINSLLCCCSWLTARMHEWHRHEHFIARVTAACPAWAQGTCMTSHRRAPGPAAPCCTAQVGASPQFTCAHTLSVVHRAHIIRKYWAMRSMAADRQQLYPRPGLTHNHSGTSGGCGGSGGGGGGDGGGGGGA